MIQVNPHLAFNGHCEEAFRLYAECLEGEITFMLPYRDSPALAASPGLADKIVHATLTIGGSKLTGADVAPTSYKPSTGTTIQLNIDDLEKIRRVYAILSEGATVHLPLQAVFWTELFAVLTDRFGTPWEINYTAPHKAHSRTN
jgi:PhnB protein